MPGTTTADRPCAGRAANARQEAPQHRPLPIQPLPELPAEILGEVPPAMLCPARTPPPAFDFLGAKATIGGHLMPCPACCRGWVALRPDGSQYGYRIATELSCTGERCAAADIAWWQCWRTGSLPKREPGEDGDQARRYFAGAVKNASHRILAARDPLHCLGREAYQLGQLAAGIGIEHEAAMRALGGVLRHTGMPVDAAARSIAVNMLAGRSRPREIPR